MKNENGNLDEHAIAKAYFTHQLAGGRGDGLADALALLMTRLAHLAAVVELTREELDLVPVPDPLATEGGRGGRGGTRNRRGRTRRDAEGRGSENCGDQDS